ncbi:flagellar motor protein MotB [Paenibacillus sp. sgz500958]|uniref:flagellar motor protein MotB n=1 Tax=Paenibacillus sp. sgz500958 TaxID=3242475 RepID=UPI0036D37B57
MRQRGRKKSPLRTRDIRDRWMITYADLITLLLIFFVVLYAMSSLDGNKYGIVTDSLSQTFRSGNPVLEGGTGILDSGPGESGSQNAGTGGQTAGSNSDSGGGQAGNGAGTGGTDAGTGNSSTGSAEEPTAREQAFKEQEAKLADLMGVITKYVQENNLGDQIFVEDKPQGIAITLSDRFLFDVGDATIKAPSLPALRKLSSLFDEIGAVISIEGHTDNTPVLASSLYKDNWELSGARALSVLRFFLEKQKLNPDKFQYAGYADTRPTADNSTEAGRQKNRRVELTVLRQLQE